MKQLQPVETDRSQGVILFVLLIFGLIMAFIKWEDVVHKQEDGTYTLRPEREREREKEKDQTENCETYALVARRDGWYECPLCPTRWYFLKTDEVWKYGITCTKPRYRRNYLDSKKLNYYPVFEGDRIACRRLEIDLNIDYPLLPENLARRFEDRLAFPPGNKRPNTE